MPDTDGQPEFMTPPFQAGENIAVQGTEGSDIYCFKSAPRQTKKTVEHRQHRTLRLSGAGGCNEEKMLPCTDGGDCLLLCLRKLLKIPFQEGCLNLR